MLAEGIWDLRGGAGGPIFPAVVVIAPGPQGFLVRMKSGGLAGDNAGQADGEAVSARIGQATWTFAPADQGRTLVVTRTSRLFGLLPRQQIVTYHRRNPV